MSDAYVHPVPSETTLLEDTRDLFDTARGFYRNNREIVLITTVIALSMVVNRRMLRRELRRLNFEVEIFGDFDPTDHDLFNVNTDR